MNLDMLKMLGSGAKMMAMLPINLLSGKANGDYPIRKESSWDEEKEDILERANWLCQQVIKEPSQLIADAPSVIGKEYQGEWAIYSCSMLTHALANISVLYLDKANQCPAIIAKLIDIVNTPEMRNYDTMQWKEDAIKSYNTTHFLDNCKKRLIFAALKRSRNEVQEKTQS